MLAGPGLAVSGLRDFSAASSGAVGVRILRAFTTPLAITLGRISELRGNWYMT